MTTDTKGFTFLFIGWMKEGTHDKVWGFIRLDSGSYYNFWGRRGKTLRFKRHAGRWSDYVLNALADKKIAKGYSKLTEAMMESVNPGFTDEFGSQFVMAKFSGAIMTDDTSETSGVSFI
jgi:hypothetical protein